MKTLLVFSAKRVLGMGIKQFDLNFSATSQNRSNSEKAYEALDCFSHVQSQREGSVPSTVT